MEQCHLKKKINILLIDLKEDGYKIDVNDNYDYIARINESYNLDYVSDESKKEKAISLAGNYWQGYQKICKLALKQFEIDANFSVKDQDKKKDHDFHSLYKIC